MLRAGLVLRAGLGRGSEAPSALSGFRGSRLRVRTVSNLVFGKAISRAGFCRLYS